MLLLKKLRDIFKHLLELHIAFYILGVYERIKINDSQYWVAFIQYTQHYIFLMQRRSFPGSS
jgi:hypothetical protein